MKMVPPSDPALSDVCIVRFPVPVFHDILSRIGTVFYCFLLFFPAVVRQKKNKEVFFPSLFIFFPDCFLF